MTKTIEKQNIPNGWKETKLSEVLLEVNERNRERAELPVLSVTNSRGFVLQSEQFARNLHSKNTSNYKIVSKEQFAYNPARINVGSIALLRKWEKGLLSPMYVVFGTKNELLNDYLQYYIQSPRFSVQVSNNTAGSVRKSLNFNAFEHFDYVYPESKQEQKKIVAVLVSVDEEIEKTKEVIKTTEKLKKGLMQQLFTRGIGHTKFKQTELGEVPDTWPVVSFGQVVNIVNGQVDPKESPYKDMVLIAPNHIEQETGHLLEKVTAEKQKAISGKYLVKKGSVIYSKIRPYLKKAVIVDEDCICSADMYPLDGGDKVDNLFLFYLLFSEKFSEYVNICSSRTGIPKVNREELSAFKFCLPNTIEQKQIATILSIVDEKIAVNKKLLAKQTELKKGLMKDLLSGVKRVEV